MPIHVLIVDPHALIRSGIQIFLQDYPDITVVGQAENISRAGDLAALLRPEVILFSLDFFVSGPASTSTARGEALHAIRGLLRAAPGCHILALRHLYEEQALWCALEAGAAGFLLKDFTPDDLARSIRFVARGHLVVCPQAAEALARGPHLPAPMPSAPLSDREMQILTCLTRGWSNPQIAHQLTLSRRTIKFHVSNILTKLGASSRTQAVARAVEYHLV